MSDLRTSFLKAKLNRLPRMPPISTGTVPEEQCDDTEVNEQPHGQPSSSGGRTTKQGGARYSPRTAEEHFDQALQVDVPLEVGSAAFRVYYTPPRPNKKTGSRTSVASVSHAVVDVTSPPTLLPGRLNTIDAGEHSEDHDSPGCADPGTVFLLHHGAGFSALSYALTAAEITRKTNGEIGVLAYDCRGHGRTQLTGVPSTPLDMSLDTLTSDLVGLLTSMYPDRERMPSLVLVGHSMGGSVVVAASQALFASGFTRISGVAVLDVVEGTAMDALHVMRSVILSHPSGFPNVEAAIQWHVDSKTIANIDSARISVPPLLQPNPAFSSHAQAVTQQDEPEEVLANVGATAGLESNINEYAYKWKADLLATEPYWKGWFQGLSSRFLATKTARLLLLAGTDRLDRELMIGQMQGKYQLEVISDVGHSLQQDAPERTARILVDFWKRNERIQLPFKNLKKVGEQ